jgi:phosphatidate cytidylyltransferase
MFALIWVNDTGAYCVGSTMGKHRLCERLSPKKSWEGFWGGMAFCVIASVIYALIMNYNVLASVAFGIIVSLFATFGDLFESLLKRSAGVKDSGKLIPGHGGVLDRIDSLLFVAPAAAIYAVFVLF